MTCLMALPSEAEWIATVGVWKKLLGTKGGASWVSWSQLVFQGDIWKQMETDQNASKYVIEGIN